MKSPNATSRYPIAAPYTSLSYPGTGAGSMSGWAWKISVVADIPFTETNSTTVDTLKNQTFAGVKAVLEAPVGFNTNTVLVDPSWHICLLHWSLDFKNFPAKFRTDEGSCSSVLSEHCRRAVEAGAIREYTTPQCRCPDYDKLASSGCSTEELKTIKAGGVRVSRCKCT